MWRLHVRRQTAIKVKNTALPVPPPPLAIPLSLAASCITLLLSVFVFSQPGALSILL